MPQTPPPNDDNRLQRFTELWMESQYVLSGFVRLQVHHHQQAEDIIQEVARDATANFDRYDPARPFAAWVIGIARQRMAEHFRKQARQSVTFSSEVLDSVQDAYCKLQPEVDDRLVALKYCVEGLSDRHRRMIRLRYDQQMSPEDIAAKIGAQRNAVNVMIHRVRKALGDCVRKRMEARP